MKIGIMAARTEKAIQTISNKTGIDVSAGKFPKSRDPLVQRMHQLELLADKLEERGSAVSNDIKTQKEILEKIKGIKGIGDALYERIVEAVLEQ